MDSTDRLDLVVVVYRLDQVDLYDPVRLLVLVDLLVRRHRYRLLSLLDRDLRRFLLDLLVRWVLFHRDNPYHFLLHPDRGHLWVPRVRCYHWVRLDPHRPPGLVDRGHQRRQVDLLDQVDRAHREDLLGHVHRRNSCHQQTTELEGNFLLIQGIQAGQVLRGFHQHRNHQVDRGFLVDKSSCCCNCNYQQLFLSFE